MRCRRAQNSLGKNNSYGVPRTTDVTRIYGGIAKRIPPFFRSFVKMEEPPSFTSRAPGACFDSNLNRSIDTWGAV